MPSLDKFLIAGFIGILAFMAGSAFGSRDCPEMAALEAVLEEAAQRDVSAMLAATSTQDATCEQIYQLVIDDLEDLEATAQENRAARPDPVGE